jgi:hypothetical protein
VELTDDRHPNKPEYLMSLTSAERRYLILIENIANTHRAVDLTYDRDHGKPNCLLAL